MNEIKTNYLRKEDEYNSFNLNIEPERREEVQAYIDHNYIAKKDAEEAIDKVFERREWCLKDANQVNSLFQELKDKLL